jgi:2-amino-4-hydroxy-6-hydroxymethyldihydropteridine diphosphokinase
MRVGLALGTNLGDRMANLRAAQKAIAMVDGVKPPLLTSAIYETEPVDCEPGAGMFLNGVIEIEYDGDPSELLEKLICVEEALGRGRDHAQNVSRKIDIDLLYADDLLINNERLQLPHPRMHERKFVLRPLSDIRPGLILPGRTETVCELLARVPDSAKVTCFAQEWS